MRVRTIHIHKQCMRIRTIHIHKQCMRVRTIHIHRDSLLTTVAQQINEKIIKWVLMCLTNFTAMEPFDCSLWPLTCLFSALSKQPLLKVGWIDCVCVCVCVVRVCVCCWRCG